MSSTPAESRPVAISATLALAMGAGPLLVHGLNAMGPLVVDELGLSRTQFGALATTTFLAGALASGGAGALVDRTSVRTTMAVLFTGSALALWASAAAPGYGWLLAAVVLSGLVQALSNPVTNRVVARIEDLGRRGAVLGVKQAGVQMAQAFAGLVLPGLALVAGWRGSLLVASVLAAAGLVLALRVIAPDPEDVASESHRPRRRERLPATVWWLTGFAFLSGCVLQVTNVYLPLYGFEELGLSSTTAGSLTAVLGAVGLVARIVWGRVAGRADSPRRALLVLVAGSLLGTGLVLLAGLTHPALVWAGAVAFGASGIAANVVLMVSVLRVVPARLVGRASGVLAMGLYLGFAVGPVSFGSLVDSTGSYGTGWVVALGVLVLAGALVLLRRDWTPPAEAR